MPLLMIDGMLELLHARHRLHLLRHLLARSVCAEVLNLNIVVPRFPTHRSTPHGSVRHRAITIFLHHQRHRNYLKHLVRYLPHLLSTKAYRKNMMVLMAGQTMGSKRAMRACRRQIVGQREVDVCGPWHKNTGNVRWKTSTHRSTNHLPRRQLSDGADVTLRRMRLRLSSRRRRWLMMHRATDRRSMRSTRNKDHRRRRYRNTMHTTRSRRMKQTRIHLLLICLDLSKR